MDQATLAPPTLFDLLARSWQRPAAITTVMFNANQTAVAFASADGSLAIAPLADPEAAAARIRIDLETGRAAIRPRSKPVRPATVVGPLADRPLTLSPYRDSGFMAGGPDGRLHQVTARGQVTRLAALDGPIIGIDRSAATGRIAMASGTEVALHSDDDLTALRRFEPAPVALAAVALSRDGFEVAAAHSRGLSIWKTTGTLARRRDLSFSGNPTGINWSPGGEWIACPLATGGFQLVRLADGASSAVSGFPAPVRTLAWSRAAGALVTSGAFRVTAWSMTHPPLDGDAAGARTTGRPGLVPVEAVAAHPVKDLVAVGYASGLIAVAQIGRRDEVLIRPDGRDAVTVLAWSNDGDHLALGTADGAAAIVGFPPQMFK